MKVVLAPIGTRGDVQPMLALAVALQKRGHRVAMCAPENFQKWVEGYGVAFRASGTDFTALLGGERDYWDGGSKVIAGVAREVPLHFAALLEECRGADVVVGAMMQFAAPSVAEKYGLPYVFAAYWPQIHRSRIHPIIGQPYRRAPAWLNRFMWWMQDFMWSVYFRGRVNRARADLGLAPIRSALQHFAYSGHAVLAYDPEVGPPPPELDEASVPHTKAGFIFLDDGAGLDPELDAFLTEGEPPVYLGFGSMKTRHPERLARLLADAASGAGRRALIAGGWAGLAAKDLPPGCRIISSAPHHALFPRVAAVVHHGGAGTTGAAARAGVPQVVVPHFGDQFYWGFRVEALGVGPAPLSRLRLSAKKLSAAIRAALSAECVARARALGERVRARDGLAEAVRVVEAAARG